MAIELGDAILRFTAETGQLDQAIARLQLDLPSKLAPAANSALALSQSLSGIGAASATVASQLQPVSTAAAATATATQNLTKAIAAIGPSATASIPPATAQVATFNQHLAVGQQGAVALGNVMTLAGTKATESMYQARGALSVFDELLGVRLPRHVQSFIAELPGVGAALSSAFSAIAVLAIVEAIAAAIEKIDEWSKRGEKIANAWKQYDQTIFESSKHMQEEIDKQEQKLIEMTAGPVAGLDFALKHLQTTAFETFNLITKDVADAVIAMKLAESSLLGLQFNVFKDAGHDLEQFKIGLEKVMRLAAEASPNDPFAAYRAGIEEVQKKERELTALINSRTAASGKDASAAVDGLHAERQAINEILPLLQKGVELQKEKDKGIGVEERLKQGEQLAAEAKRDLASELATIEAQKAARHTAFVAGEIDLASWTVAQKNATDATVAVNERYLARIVDIYKQSGDAVKSQAAAQDLATAQVLDGAKQTEALAAATQKYHEATLKIVKDWEDLQNKQVAKDFEAAGKAADELTKSELRLADAQAKLALEKITQDFGPQEAAIKRLADFGIITENQKAERLRVAYELEERQALDALNKLLDAEQKARAAAESKLEAKKASPFVTPAEVSEAQKNLDEIQRSIEKTSREIEKTTGDFEQKRLAVQRGAVAEAIALAQSEGRAKLASALLYKQAQIDEINDEIREAKAHGQNTVELEKERKERERTIKQLELEAHQSTILQKTIVDLKNIGKQAFDDLTRALEQSIAQAILGEASFGDALRKGVAQELAAISAKAAVKAIFETAEGFALLAAQDYTGAGQAFTSAGIYASIALASGISARALNPQSSSSSGSSPAGGSGATEGQITASQPEQQPIQTVNEQHLFAGGLVTQRTRAIIGDARSGSGSQREAVAPVDDPAYKEAMWGYVSDRLEGVLRGGGDTNYNVTIKGMIDSSNLRKTMKNMGKLVTQGKGRLTVNTAFRHTSRG